MHLQPGSQRHWTVPLDFEPAFILPSFIVSGRVPSIDASPRTARSHIGREVKCRRLGSSRQQQIDSLEIDRVELSAPTSFWIGGEIRYEMFVLNPPGQFFPADRHRLVNGESRSR